MKHEVEIFLNTIDGRRKSHLHLMQIPFMGEPH